MTKTQIIIAIIFLGILAFAPWEKSFKKFTSIRSTIGMFVIGAALYCLRAWGFPWVETNMSEIPLFTSPALYEGWKIFLKLWDSAIIATAVLLVLMIVARIISKIVQKVKTKHEEKQIREEERAKMRNKIRNEEKEEIKNDETY